MWPWSKIKALETEVDTLRHKLVLVESELKLAQQKINRMTDRDARGRFKK